MPLLHFLFFRTLVFLHIRHNTGHIPFVTLPQQFSFTLPVLVSWHTGHIQVRPLHMAVSRGIKCLTFFNDLFALYLRHRAQIPSAERKHLLLRSRHGSPEERLALSELLNSTDQTHAQPSSEMKISSELCSSVACLSQETLLSQSSCKAFSHHPKQKRRKNRLPTISLGESTFGSLTYRNCRST